MVFDDRLRRVFRVLEAVELALGNAERLNEFNPTVWRVDRFKCWIFEECKSNNVGLIIEPDGAVRGNPVVLPKPFARLKNIPSEILKEIADPDRVFGWRQFACQSKCHFKTESTVITADRFFVVV